MNDRREDVGSLVADAVIGSYRLIRTLSGKKKRTFTIIPKVV